MVRGGEMTRDEIVKLEAGREMDALVAEKVMGWELRTFKNDGVDFWHIPGTARCELDAPRFSSDIGAAWEVVTHMQRPDDETGYHEYYFKLECTVAAKPVYWYAWLGEHEAEAATAPLAICRAALLAVMEDE
jgi:hypothetical protein